MRAHATARERGPVLFPFVMVHRLFQRVAHAVRASHHAPLARALRLHRRVALPTALVLLAGAGACSEKLDSGATCTTLCPLANEQLRDTVLDPVAFDTTLSGFPLLGANRPLLLATAPSPDSVDVRAVVQFDTLPSTYTPPAGGAAVAITGVDDTFVRLRFDTTLVATDSGTATLEAYDVDTGSASDTATTTLAPLFTPARRLGSAAITFAKGRRVADSLHLHLSDSAFAYKAQTKSRLRLGFRLTSTSRAQLRIFPVRTTGGVLSSFSPAISFDPSTDTVYKAVNVNPSSSIATGESSASLSAAVDQTLAVVSPSAAVAGDLVVGGVPGRRSYLRFALPLKLTDSTDVVRAVLELTQHPARYVAATDTVRALSEAVLATAAVTDLRLAAQLTAPSGFSLDSLVRSPADSGTVQLSVVSLIRSYRSLPASTTRALSIRSPLEGAQPAELRFFSAAAPAAVRPRLRLTYIPRTSFGVP